MSTMLRCEGAIGAEVVSGFGGDIETSASCP